MDVCAGGDDDAHAAGNDDAEPNVELTIVSRASAQLFNAISYFN